MKYLAKLPKKLWAPNKSFFVHIIPLHACDFISSSHCKPWHYFAIHHNFSIFLASMFLLVLLLITPSTNAKCSFPAIFNFGDSNSDTGGFWAAFPAERYPFGMTYFKKPSGRASDGRLVIDFLGN